jgi:hypothetical protein
LESRIEKMNVRDSFVDIWSAQNDRDQKKQKNGWLFWSLHNIILLIRWMLLLTVLSLNLRVVRR